MRPFPRPANLVVLAVLLGAEWYVDKYRLFDLWTRFADLALICALFVSLTVILRGYLRNATLVAASALFALTAVEAYARITLATGPTHIYTPRDQTIDDPVMGTRPAHAGVFHHAKLAAGSGSVIYDVDYTIDEHHNRQVISAAEGPTVAFFGDSFTFGEGLPDSDTLPQLFADLTGRSLRVMNFSGSGYGPQQFLRPLETAAFDDLLGAPRLFVFQTAPWHAERSACIPDYTMNAPRYVLIGGRPQYKGRCRDPWQPYVGRFFTLSMYSAFVQQALSGPTPARLDLYVATLVRAGEIARDKYHAPTAINYLPDAKYLRGSGSNDAQIMQRLRDGGLAVIDGRLDQNDFPGQPLSIPGDGHPTGVANRARAQMLRDWLAAHDAAFRGPRLAILSPDLAGSDRR